VVDLVTEQGRRFATVGGELQEVVVATANDVNALGYDGVSLLGIQYQDLSLIVTTNIQVAPGVYVTGTGNTGAAKTFATLGVGYFAAMVAGSAGQRVPAADWKPQVRMDSTIAWVRANSALASGLGAGHRAEGCYDYAR